MTTIMTITAIMPITITTDADDAGQGWNKRPLWFAYAV